MTKQCTGCQRDLPLDAFSQDAKKRDGLRSHCKACAAASWTAYYGTHRTSILAPKPVSEPLPATKPCSLCRRDLVLSAFGTSKRGQYGLQSQCRECRKHQKSLARQARKAQNLATPPPVDLDTLKWCSGCEQDLPYRAFSADLARRDGFKTQCRACCARHQRGYNQRHAERLRAPKPVEHLDPHTTVKICPRCLMEKPLEEYAICRSKPDGRQAHCKDCRAKAFQVYIAASDHRERLNQRAAERRREHPEMGRRHQETRRARKRGGTQIDVIDMPTLYARDKGICSLCHKRVSLKRTWPDPLCATTDHIIPLSKGGTHTWPNVALAHYGCNRKKNRTVKTQQMRLF